MFPIARQTFLFLFMLLYTFTDTESLWKMHKRATSWVTNECVWYRNRTYALTALEVHSRLHLLLKALFKNMPHSSNCSYATRRNLKGTGAGVWGGHRGQPDSRSKPNPQQLPHWCPYFAGAWGSHWELGWKKRKDLSLWAGGNRSQLLSPNPPASLTQSWYSTKEQNNTRSV